MSCVGENACKTSTTTGSNSVVLRRVRKKRYQQEQSTTNHHNHNESRIFFTSQRKGCELFSCGQKIHVFHIVNVRKTANSGDRWFSCCGKGNASSCNCEHFSVGRNKRSFAYTTFKLTPLL